jgi:hypothetical protein
MTKQERRERALARREVDVKFWGQVAESLSPEMTERIERAKRKQAIAKRDVQALRVKLGKE